MIYELKDVLVSIRDVSLKFTDAHGSDTLILRPTTIDVRDIVCPNRVTGQVIGVLGPSGIGKTQFARVLAGLQKPTTGDVFVADTRTASGAARMAPVKPGSVGMVFQNYPLFRHRTVDENLSIALAHDESLTQIDRRGKISRYLQEFDLKSKRELYPAQLSGGQRQRVAIIQQLLSSEHFLVMDEPFTGLDPIMKDRVCELISSVASLDERNTIFVVAHDIAALVAISDALWLFGRDLNADGSAVPGARIKKTYNLIDRDLAYRKDISLTPEFADFVREVKEEFYKL